MRRAWASCISRAIGNLENPICGTWGDMCRAGIVRLTAKDVISGVIITEKLKSYSAAKAEVMPGVEHLQQKYQNNRAENSHQPTRLRERVMRRFKSAGHAQRFLSAFGILSSHFRVSRHLLSAHCYREGYC